MASSANSPLNAPTNSPATWNQKANKSPPLLSLGAPAVTTLGKHLKPPLPRTTTYIFIPRTLTMKGHMFMYFFIESKTQSVYFISDRDSRDNSPESPSKAKPILSLSEWTLFAIANKYNNAVTIKCTIDSSPNCKNDMNYINVLSVSFG